MTIYRQMNPFLDPLDDILMDYSQMATLLTLILTLWVRLGADRYSIILKGLPSYGIVAINVSTLVVGICTMYLQMKGDKHLRKVRSRLSARAEEVAARVKSISVAHFDPRRSSARTAKTFDTVQEDSPYML